MATNKVKEARVHLASGVSETLKIKRGQTIANELSQLDILLRTSGSVPGKRFSTVKDKLEGESEMGIRSMTIINDNVVETFIQTRDFKQTGESMNEIKSRTNVAIASTKEEAIAKLNTERAAPVAAVIQETDTQPVTQVTQPQKEETMTKATTVDNATETKVTPSTNPEQTTTVATEAVAIGISWNADAALKAADDNPQAEVPTVEKKGFFKDMSLTKKIFVGVGAVALVAGAGFGGYKYYQSRKEPGSLEMDNVVGG